jgi:23S rRNA (guanosine2251-2'-O)-methyltransferase
MLAENEELVAGRRPVEEAFAAGRSALRLLVVPHRREALENLVLHATRLRIPIVELEGGSLTAIAGFDGHQGVALVVEPRRFASLDDVLARALERGESPLVLALDSLEDPQNLGTLLRSAEAAGVHGVIFPRRRQAPLTPSAVKATAGAVEHLLLVPVDDLAGALADLHVRGLRVAGSEADAPLTARQADLRGPLVLVVGSEGQGLGPAVRRRCDLLMRIPMRGAIGSLNAAVAGSILLFEAAAQRDFGAASVALSQPPVALAEAPGPGDEAEPAVAPAAPEPSGPRRRRKATVAETEPEINPSTESEAGDPTSSDQGADPEPSQAVQSAETDAEGDPLLPEPARARRRRPPAGHA